MAINRIFLCDCCGFEETEKEYGLGVMGWGQLLGVQWEEEPVTEAAKENFTPKKIRDPLFCPKCMSSIKIHVAGMFREQSIEGHKLGD